MSDSIPGPAETINEKPALDGQPTQVANPHRTSVRSIIQLGLTLFTAVPAIVLIINGTWGNEWLSGVLAQVIVVHTVIVRFFSLPGVNQWITENLPWLAPAKPVGT